jgi:hypothetical protein
MEGECNATLSSKQRDAMDANLQVFLWLAGGGGFFAVLGGLFGAVAGALYWHSGRASGTAFGLGVAQAFARVADKELSRPGRGAITGAADGVLFLGPLGILAGAVVVSGGWADSRWLAVGAWLALCVAAAAVLFGVLAYAMVRVGFKVLAPACGGGVLGALAGAWLGDVAGLMLGLLTGILIGTAVLALLGRKAPADHS